MTPPPVSFDAAFVNQGNVIALCHDQRRSADSTWLVAFTAGEDGAKVVASKEVPGAERDGWLTELARQGIVVGATYGAAGIVWAATGETFTIWLPGKRIVRTRAELEDPVKVSSRASDDHVDRMVWVHFYGGRAELLAMDRDDVARVDPTYGRFEMLESDGRWCAYCARDLARWLRVRFDDETFGLPSAYYPPASIV